MFGDGVACGVGWFSNPSGEFSLVIAVTALSTSVISPILTTMLGCCWPVVMECVEVEAVQLLKYSP